MLELLIALLIVGGGVMALLKTQLSHATAETEMAALIQAHLLLSDIRRKLDVLDDAAMSVRAGFGQAPAASVDCRGHTCTATQLAEFYTAHWKCRLGKWSDTSLCKDSFGLSGLLPDGDGRIQPAGDGLQITLRWRDAQGQLRTLSDDYVGR